MRKGGYLVGGAIALFASPVAAESGTLMSAYTLPLDANATASEATMAYVHSIKARSPDWSRTMTSIDAERIVGIVTADGVLDSDETDLLEELASDRWALNLKTAGGDGATTMFLPFSKENRGPIEAALDGAWEDEWNGGDAGWARIVALYTSPHHHGSGRAISIVRRKMGPAWAASDIGNAYGPFRKLVSTTYNANMTLPPESQKYGRWMLYYAAQRTDEAAERDMPDMLYSWIKPE